MTAREELEAAINHNLARYQTRAYNAEQLLRGTLQQLQQLPNPDTETIRLAAQISSYFRDRMPTPTPAPTSLKLVA